MLQSEMVPTRSAILKLREEHDVIIEAYDFLDEKRLLLAAELLRQLTRYEELLEQYETIRQEAEKNLIATVRRHGLQGTQIYPGNFLEDAELDLKFAQFMGVKLIDSKLIHPDEETRLLIPHPSPEAESCRSIFLSLVKLASILAGVSGNLHRLLLEYRKTERRARALENVVIPEVQQKLKEMTSQVEEIEQEESIRVHINKK